jgi:hypothetical protein
MREVGRPESDTAVLVPKVYHGVVEVLRHSGTRTEFCPVFDNKLSRRRVLIFEITGITLYWEVRLNLQQGY